MIDSSEQQSSHSIAQEKIASIFADGVDITVWRTPQKSKIPIVAGVFDSVSELTEYFRQLSSRKVETNRANQFSIYFATITSTSRHMLLYVFVAIIFSLFMGFIGGCGQLMSMGCAYNKFEETRLQLPQNAFAPRPQINTTTATNPTSANGAPSQTLPTSEEVSINELEGTTFNVPKFQATLLFFAFGLAFTRWQIGNRQSSMSELFERKKEVNLLIFRHHSDLAGLVSGATSSNLISHKRVGEFLEKAKCQKIIDDITQKRRNDSDIKFTEKIFTFIELDNLEFALSKYKSGLLDTDQMYRSCEIFESRCMNENFRYLAAIQGLNFYNEDFHRLLSSLLIRGHYFSTGSASDDE